MANEIEREIAQMADALETKRGRFPRRVGEIPGCFPYSNFKGLLLAFETKELLLQRFAYELLNFAFDTLATPSERFRMYVYGSSWIFIPLISLVLGYFASWWFILINLLILVFMSRAKKLYNRVIYRGAFDSELVFCFLYCTGQVCVTTADFEKTYYWSHENKRSVEEVIGMQEEEKPKTRRRSTKKEGKEPPPIGADEIPDSEVNKAASEAAKILSVQVVLDELHKYEVESTSELDQEGRVQFMAKLRELLNDDGATDEETFLNADTGLAFSELDKAMSGQHGIAFTVIKPQIEQLLRHSKETLAPTMRKTGISHEVIVLAAAKLILDDVLPSGNYHIYRGVLSQKGHFLFDLYNFAVRKLWAEGPDQEVSADAEINSMEEAISKVG